MLLTEWNTDDAIAYARKEGREEGWEERNIEIARNFKNMGLSVSQIALGTGLSPELIKEL